MAWPGATLSGRAPFTATGTVARTLGTESLGLFLALASASGVTELVVGLGKRVKAIGEVSVRTGLVAIVPADREQPVGRLIEQFLRLGSLAACQQDKGQGFAIGREDHLHPPGERDLIDQRLIVGNRLSISRLRFGETILPLKRIAEPRLPPRRAMIYMIDPSCSEGLIGQALDQEQRLADPLLGPDRLDRVLTVLVVHGVHSGQLKAIEGNVGFRGDQRFEALGGVGEGLIGLFVAAQHPIECGDLSE